MLIFVSLLNYVKVKQPIQLPYEDTLRPIVISIFSHFGHHIV